MEHKRSKNIVTSLTSKGRCLAVTSASKVHGIFKGTSNLRYPHEVILLKCVNHIARDKTHHSHDSKTEEYRPVFMKIKKSIQSSFSDFFNTGWFKFKNLCFL
jgi:hypothetical protein